MTQNKEQFVIHAKTRTALGKKSKYLHDDELLPAVTYGSKVKSQSLTLELREFKNVYKDAGESTLVDLEVDGKDTKKVLIYGTQIDPISSEPIHADLYQVRMDEKIKTNVPINFVGESPAVKGLGGTLSTNKLEVEVECLPADLISEIEVDISILDSFDVVVNVKDLKVPNTVEILDDPEELVAQVEEPRSEEELAELDEKPEEDLESIEVAGAKEDTEDTEEGSAEGEDTPTETQKDAQ
jgi:large subunit ribosomal protein L25